MSKVKTGQDLEKHTTVCTFSTFQEPRVPVSKNKKKDIDNILKWKDKYAGKVRRRRVEKSCAENARSVCIHTCVCRAADVFTRGHACVHAPDPVSQWKLVAGKWNSVTHVEHSASQHENYFSKSNPTINPFSSYTYFTGRYWSLSWLYSLIV